MAVATIAQPDGPLLFFWLLTLDRLSVALEDPDRLAPWLGVGLAWGGAMLSKYHAVLLPAGVLLHMVLWPQARRCLRAPGPYLAAAIGLMLFAPVILWNATHGWASFLFQGGVSGWSGIILA
jgi:4-amino-4-deoxy-L-arabinose transferase-like glycosyltransferase